MKADLFRTNAEHCELKWETNNRPCVFSKTSARKWGACENVPEH